MEEDTIDGRRKPRRLNRETIKELLPPTVSVSRAKGAFRFSVKASRDMKLTATTFVEFFRIDKEHWFVAISPEAQKGFKLAPDNRRGGPPCFKATSAVIAEMVLEDIGAKHSAMLMVHKTNHEFEGMVCWRISTKDPLNIDRK
jgi:hypothetical protein